MNVDWVSPTLGYALNLPANEGDRGRGQKPENRLRYIFETAFVCPANREFYDYAHNGGDTIDGIPVTDLRVSSYGSPIAFHYWPEVNDRRFLHTGTWSAFPGRYTGYRPQMSFIKRPETKAITLDGTRYVRQDNHEISFSWDRAQIRGGNFMLAGPSTVDSSNNGGDPHTLAEDSLPAIAEHQDALERYAYRHSGGMVVSFFDGHAEWMSQEESRTAHYWFPSGTQLISPTLDPEGPREIR